jgi:hypothetical protein
MIGTLDRVRHPEQQASRVQMLCESRAIDSILAFRCGASRLADEPAERCVSAGVLGEHDYFEPVLTRKLAAYDKRERQVFGRRMRSHDAGHRAFVGQCETRIPELGRGCNELVGMRGAAQEREIAEAV